MVPFYFDFISPYSYLAVRRIERDFPDLALSYRPVALGTIFSKLDVRGPGEVPRRRRAGLQDVLLLADHYGFELEGPPSHPFNSIYALRSVCAVADGPQRTTLTRRYFQAAWADGESLEDLAVLRRCLADVGVDHDPEDVATTRQFRAALKGYTKEALGAGAWGVPTFVADGIVFFGQDRLELLAAHLAGRLDRRADKLEEMLARPQPGGIA